ncbi:MAG: response regulator transcription factor [Dermatophilaceae bacterium]
MSVTTVVIVDDEQLMLQALKMFVSAAPDLIVVGEAVNGVDAVERCAQLKPDIVLMDLQMPLLNGIDATRRIHATQPAVKIIAVTTFGTTETIVPALRAGASGYLLKDIEPEALVQAIRDVRDGQNVLSPAVTSDLVQAVRSHQGPPEHPLQLLDDGASEALSGRELAVVKLLAQGLSNADIAAELFLSEAAVKSRLSQLTQKFGVNNRVQVLVRACELGLVQPRLRRPGEAYA